MVMFDMIVFQVVIVGLGACVIFDVWQQIFHRVTSIPPSDWSMVGRWAINLVTNSQLVTHNLESQPKRKGELWVGWLVHYVIAIILIFIKFETILLSTR